MRERARSTVPKEAQDHWERVVRTKLGHTSRLFTDMTQSRHLNSHIPQSVAGAAAGTLRKHLQRWSFWSEWALACGIHPGQPTQANMAGFLHEVISGARQDRSSVRTVSVAGVIQGLKFVGRKEEQLLAVLDTPLIVGYLAGAAAPRPRREALPLPLAALVQWERWTCRGSAPEHEVLFIGGILLMAWAGLRFADAQRTCPASLLPDRHVRRSECWRSKVSRSGQTFGDLGVLQWAGLFFRLQNNFFATGKIC